MIFSRMKRAFEVKKKKTFFLVWEVLSFRLKKTCTNVADTTFKKGASREGVEERKVDAEIMIPTKLTLPTKLLCQ